jgi:hypothetical protein
LPLVASRWAKMGQQPQPPQTPQAQAGDWGTAQLSPKTGIIMGCNGLQWAATCNMRHGAAMGCIDRPQIGSDQTKRAQQPIVDPNCVLGQPLRPARKLPGSRSRGAYEARGATRNFRTEVGSSTRRHPVAQRARLLRPGSSVFSLQTGPAFLHKPIFTIWPDLVPIHDSD